MKNGLLRIAILMGLPVLLALGNAAVRPASLSSSSEKTPEERGGREMEQTAEQKEAAVQNEMDRIIQHYNDGTALFVDARPLDQYEEAHVPGAFHLPFSAFFQGQPEAVNYLPPEMLLIIYCEGGDCDSSKKVKEMLADYGYDNVEVLDAGFPAWIDAGLPTESGSPTI